MRKEHTALLRAVRERHEKNALTRCTCQFLKDDFGAPLIHVCAVCEAKMQADMTRKAMHAAALREAKQ